LLTGEQLNSTSVFHEESVCAVPKIPHKIFSGFILSGGAKGQYVSWMQSEYMDASLRSE